MAAPDIVFLAGPTAVGKSAVALRLAERLGGEIVSVDSMQVYRGLNLGTAKPSAAEQARVRHHLIDVVELDEEFDAARFVRQARAAEAEIRARGKVPIFCGGTGLYFRAYLEGLGESPPTDAALRAVLEAAPLAELLEELERRDPETFARIDRKNPRRVVRAVEVIRLTGKTFSEQRAEWRSKNVNAGGTGGSAGAGAGAGAGADADESVGQVVFGLTRPVAALRRRVDARVEEMFARGLVAETQVLLAAGLEQNRTAMQAIGYRQVVEHLRGERSLAETIALVKARTWAFARRQLNWFRNQMRMEWVEIADAESPDAVCARISARASVENEKPRMDTDGHG